MRFTEAQKKQIMDEYKSAIREVFDNMRPYLRPEGVLRIGQCIRRVEEMECPTELTSADTELFAPAMAEEMQIAKEMGTLPPEDWAFIDVLTSHVDGGRNESDSVH